MTLERVDLSARAAIFGAGAFVFSGIVKLAL
jgi:hypothetical protein